MTNNDDDHAQKGKDFWNQPLTFEAKGLFLALGKGALHAVSLKWDDVAADALDAVAAVGRGRGCRARSRLSGAVAIRAKSAAS